MFTETRGWIATGILTPICLVVLSWTLVIYHSNRRKWQSKDFIISTILSQCIIKQIATFLYTLIVLLKPVEYFETYCGCVKWIITSVDLFQAATIGTLILTRLLAVRFPLKFRAMMKRTHINYHLITLGILSSCIGIASILAEKAEASSPSSSLDAGRHCTFLPYELNPKYAFLSIALNGFISLATLFALFWVIASFLSRKQPMSNAKACSTLSTIRHSSNTSRLALMTSSSDLSQASDLSLRSQYANRDPTFDKTNYRTNSNHRKGRAGARLFLNVDGSCGETGSFQQAEVATLGNSSTDTLLSSKLAPSYHQFVHGPGSKPTPPREGYSPGVPVNRWASEFSYLSTSPSSTSSRAPCLGRPEHLGLPTSAALFIWCFLLTHLPFLGITVVGTFLPYLLPPLPITAYLLWAGVLQDLLLPVILAIVDRNFKVWLRQMYTRQHRTPLSKQQGLDGKFRVFGSPLSQPSLAHAHAHAQQEAAHHEPIKFPITNGSLFTSVDGRLPIIHNYRRGHRPSGQCVSMGVPVCSRRPTCMPGQPAVANCYQQCNVRINTHLNLLPGSYKDDSEDAIPFEEHERHHSNRDLFHENLERTNEHLQERIGNLNLDHLRSSVLDHSDYDDIHLDLNGYDSEPIYATLSSGSCCSATTAANDDFEFYQSHNNLNDDSTTGVMLISQFGDADDKFVALDDKPIQNIDNVNSQLDSYVDEDKVSNNCQRRSQRRLQDAGRPLQNEPRLLQETGHGLQQHNAFSTNFIDSCDVDENVSKLDRYLQQLHQGHVDDKEKLRNVYKARTQHHRDIEILVPVLESLNNLKQLKELMTPQNCGERDSVRKLQGNKDTVRSQDYASGIEPEMCSGKSMIELHPNMKHKLFDEEDESTETCESESNDNQNHRIYRKTQVNRRGVDHQVARRSNRPPMNRRLLKPKRLEKTPPLNRRLLIQAQPAIDTKRHCRAKMVPVLSVDSLTAALRNAGVSYLDNGDLCKHDREISGSVPDFKKIFVSDFI